MFCLEALEQSRLKLRFRMLLYVGPLNEPFLRLIENKDSIWDFGMAYGFRVYDFAFSTV